MYFSESELILRPDNSVYHLGVRGEDIADVVIIVGDPDRVAMISNLLDSVRVRKSSREFCIHTGTIGSRELTIVSSGIGVDNIDIVINELDAAVNINPETREVNEHLRKLQFIRLGTSGALDPDIEVHDVVCSAAAIGMDGVPHFYNIDFDQGETELVEAFKSHVSWPSKLAEPYAVFASPELVNQFGSIADHKGITVTANGFYGPQNRQLRGRLRHPELEASYCSFRHQHLRITNFEMETAGIYALSRMLGHSHITLCVILANRMNKVFSQQPGVAVKDLINKALESLST